MMVMGQQDSANRIAGLLESAPTDEITLIVIVFLLTVSALIIAVTFCITSTIRVVRITSINADLAEKLVKQGVPHDQVERIVSANQRTPLSFPCRSSGWRRPESPLNGKPAPLQTSP